MHVYCRSTTIPHYDDNIKERVARDDDGKTYKVPEDITYPEWEKKYAPEAAEPVTVESPAKQSPETPLPTIDIMERRQRMCRYRSNNPCPCLQWMILKPELRSRGGV